MSLINDALKKAQKMRSHEDGSAAPQSVASGSRQGSSRSPAWGTQWILLLVAGSAVLVSVSVFATVYLLRKPVSSIAIKSEERVGSIEPESSTAKPNQPVSVPTESPSLILPSLPVAESKPGPASTPAAKDAAPASVTPTTAQKSEPPKLAAANKPLVNAPAAKGEGTATPPPPAVDPSKPNPKAQAFVDAVKVTGIRASGGESKVLMNDRVYRLNDLVERTLGLRLIEVSTERLVFVDENGIRYTRNF